MTSNFLDRLDDATGSRCACGCGRPVTQASPSAYFACESCSVRWHRPIALAAWKARAPGTRPAAASRGLAASVLLVAAGARQMAAAFDRFITVADLKSD